MFNKLKKIYIKTEAIFGAGGSTKIDAKKYLQNCKKKLQFFGYEGLISKGTCRI